MWRSVYGFITWTGPKSNDRCPHERHTEERHPDRRGEGRVNVEAETGVLQPSASERPESPKLGDGGAGSPLELPQGVWPCRHPEFGLAAIRVARHSVAVVVSYEVDGHSLQEPQEMTIRPNAHLLRIPGGLRS